MFPKVTMVKLGTHLGESVSVWGFGHGKGASGSLRVSGSLVPVVMLVKEPWKEISHALISS